VLRRCQAMGVPVAIAMAGGYAADIDTIVQIHAATIGLASSLCAARSESSPGQLT
jgi:acetoin utilization deacetylase AcuC-like enzyme